MSTQYPTWTESYKITSYLINLRRKAGLHAILNFIQDVGWAHAFKLGVKLPENQGWVFTRQKLEMTEWPNWNETLTIKTWLREPEGSFIFRDYELFTGDKKIGVCTSSFTVMDLQTRKLALVDWKSFPSYWRTEGTFTTKPEKIKYESEVEDVIDFEVRNSDIDLNEHVNNTKYAQWILDSVPINILRGGGVVLRDYEVNFLSEMKLGEVVAIQRILESPRGVIQFQGVRKSDQKPVFTAKLTLEDAP